MSSPCVWKGLHVEIEHMLQHPWKCACVSKCIKDFTSHVSLPLESHSMISITSCMLSYKTQNCTNVKNLDEEAIEFFCLPIVTPLLNVPWNYIRECTKIIIEISSSEKHDLQSPSLLSNLRKDCNGWLAIKVL